jgi:electron transfer flavoprotein alpha subunit
MIDVNRQGEVWIFAEQENGSLHDVALELCGKARRLADQLGVAVGAVLPGGDIAGGGLKKLAGELIAHGADRVYLVDDKRLSHYQTNSYTQVMASLIDKHQPQIVLYGATPVGRDLAPRVASTVTAGLTADCTALDIQDVTDKKTETVHDKLLLQIRPAFGGNIIATIVNYDRWPQMATVREGVMPLGEPDMSRKGRIVEETVELDGTALVLELIERHVEEQKVNLKASRIVVAGGGGVGSKDNFRLIYELAGILGGVPAASRAAVDSGYIGKEYQIGQTGTTVRPALYIAVGISGAVQHRSGMEESAKIIAINDDPDAPILSLAHYAIVGDLNKVVPMLIKAIKEKE